MSSLTRSATAIADDPRFSDSMVHEITSLAEALQEREHHRSGNLTAAEMEAAGAEVGIEPDFIRRAMSEVNQRTAVARLERGRRVEFGSLLGALVLPLVWGVLAYVCGFSHGLQQFFTLIAPAPLALILGFVAGRKSAGTIAGISLMLSLVPALAEMLTRMHSHNVEGPTVLYALFGSLFVGWLGRIAAGLRAEYFPLPTARQSVTRDELLSLVASLRPETERDVSR